jgi:hypothetical protein
MCKPGGKGGNDAEPGSGTGATAAAAAAAAAAASAAAPNAARPVLPLSLFQPNDPKQLGLLFSLTSHVPEQAHHYLRQHVFPAVMNFQKVLRSAAAQHFSALELSSTAWCF